MTGVPLFTQTPWPHQYCSSYAYIAITRRTTGLWRYNERESIRHIVLIGNGLALNLEAVTVRNIVTVDHGEIDEHGFPFSVAWVDHIYNDRNSERYSQMRVCYHTVRFSRGQKKAKIVDSVKLLSSTFVRPDQIAAPNANKQRRKATYVPYLDFIKKTILFLSLKGLWKKVDCLQLFNKNWEQ